MKIRNKIKIEHSSVVTIGTFDGVHIGHQKIIARLINTAKQEGLKSVILTFFPHPRMVLQKDSHIKLINTIEERYAILESLGIDYLFVKKFTADFSRMGAEDFVKDILVDKLRVKKVIIGYDHRFGRNRNADIEDLRQFGLKYDFEVEEISAQEINEVSVSSTKIRKALAEGDIRKANAYLGYDFMLTGTVTKGKGLGKQLGFPTANIYIKEDYKLIPKQGAYIVKSTIDGVLVYGMMNIGVNPTVNGENLSLEVHFFNFNKDLYNNRIRIELIGRLRDEQKFDSLEILKTQLEKDKLAAKSYISNLNVK
ncbi:bifunctional riboflavin kinase/FAD synthetase [Aestuariivivens sediminis]|uniref:bifunctional riboflavin kinase/FAD synthetase n=1 Tax=Aestuariivivens sediminis TaxID=2913557 RepID=UPI001F5A33E8|nr:bifunctional riboflavin kinase/FAD synthetase [Aestuariivivens sediminis]